VSGTAASGGTTCVIVIAEIGERKSEEEIGDTHPFGVNGGTHRFSHAAARRCLRMVGVPVLAVPAFTRPFTRGRSPASGPFAAALTKHAHIGVALGNGAKDRYIVFSARLRKELVFRSGLQWSAAPFKPTA